MVAARRSVLNGVESRYRGGRDRQTKQMAASARWWREGTPAARVSVRCIGTSIRSPFSLTVVIIFLPLLRYTIDVSKTRACLIFVRYVTR